MGYSVLIVDNAPYARKLLRAKFEQNGYTVVGEAESTAQAVESYRRGKPDLVTVDIMLTAESGIDTLRALIKLDPAARVVIISALSDPDTMARAKEYGARAYVTKTGDWPSIEAGVKQALEQPPRQ